VSDDLCVSIVLPCYRGAHLAQRHVPTLTDHLDALDVTYEILIVDDGSPDATATASLDFGPQVRVIRYARNRGKGFAVRTGMRAARGRFRFYTDIDIPYELDALDRALWYLAVMEYGMVAGDRTLETSRYFDDITALREHGSRVYAGIVGRFVTGGWYDTQCGFKGFRAAVADDLFRVARIDRFAFDVELFYIALKRNYDIRRMPVHLRVNEDSTVRLLRDGARMFGDLVRIRANQVRGHYHNPDALRAPVEPPLDRDRLRRTLSDAT